MEDQGDPMKNKVSFVWISLSLLFFVSLLFAGCSITSITTSAVSSAQVGDTVTVTVTLVGSGTPSGTLYLYGSSGLTIDPTTGRTLGSCSGTNTFIVTAAVAGDHTYYAQFGSERSSEAIVQFVSPNVLTVLPASNPSSVSNQALNSPFTLTIIVYNPSGTNITTSYSFTYTTSVISLSGSTSGSLTVASGDTTTLTRSVTPTNYFSGEKVLFNLGTNPGAFTTTLSTVSAPSGKVDKKIVVEEETPPDTTKPAVTTICSADSACAADEYCSEGKCIKVTGTCGYASDHKWIKYECCEDNDCATGYECKEHKCVEKEIVPPLTVTKEQAQAAIDSANSAIITASKEGKDVTAAKKKLFEAQNAFGEGNYEQAKKLSEETKALAEAAKSVSVIEQTEVIVTVEQPKKDEKKPFDWSSLVLGGIVVLILILVAVYYFMKKGSGGYSYKGRVR